MPTRGSFVLLARLGVFCVAVQLVSATWFVADFETPNASTALARNLAATGDYAVPAHLRPLRVDDARRLDPQRAYLLPGEPVLLAGAFRFLPAWLHRYVHVPVTALFVTAVAAVALALGGRRTAVTAALIATIDPFVVRHGPVWDDVMLGAALEWSVIAIGACAVAQRRTSRAIGWAAAAAAVLAAGAAWTRFSAQVELAIIGFAVIAVPALRQARAIGIAAALGVAAAVAVWGTRNFLVLGTLLLTTSHDGQSLWQSNHARARASILETGVAQTLAPTIAFPPGSEVDADRALRRDALAYIRANPADAAATAVLKTFVSVSGIDFGARSRVRNAVAVGANTLLFAFAIAGWRAWRHRRAPDALTRYVMLCGATIALVTLVLLLTGPVGIRYRMTATGFAYVLAAVSIARITARLSSPRVAGLTTT